MENLLKETTIALKEQGKTWDDVLWVGSKDLEISVSNFKAMANKKYNDGYGAPLVPMDLVIVGDSWWLERQEYDGAEFWQFKEQPKRPRKRGSVKTLITSGYYYLADCQGGLI